MTLARTPALFLGHGSPMTVISDVPERRVFEVLGQKLANALPALRALLVVSAHWETQGQTLLTAQQQPRTIHDFRGFPQELYDITYPAPGAPWLVERVVELLGADRVRPDHGWGFDHGAWGVARPMFPDGDIPMVVMSLDRTLSPQQHLELGRKLAPLRDEGVLLIGSGNVIHNLALWGRSMGQTLDWAVEFRERISRAMIAGDTTTLTRLDPDDVAAVNAVNSAEHYLPLLYAAGARLPGDEVAVFNDSLDGSLSMTSYLVGDPRLGGIQ